jgi:hypothetical protein
MFISVSLCVFHWGVRSVSLGAFSLSAVSKRLGDGRGELLSDDDEKSSAAVHSA